MRRLPIVIITILAALLVSLAAVTIASAGHNSNGLVGYWPGYGNPNDLSGHGFDGTFTSATYGPGKVGQAFSLQNFPADSVVVSGMEVSEFSPNHTISFWIKWRNESPLNAYTQIMAKLSPERAPGIWTCPPNGDPQTVSGIHWKYVPGNVGPHCVGPQGDNSEFLVDRWYHIAGVKDGTTFKLFIDGKQVGQDHAVPLNFGQGAGDFKIGSTNWATIDGLIDEVRIYNRSLTRCEIGDLAENPCRLVSHWEADGDYLDSTDGNDGSPVNGTAFAAGNLGQAFSFDGVDDYVQVGDKANLRITDGLTVSAWIYPTGPGSAGGGGIIVNKEGEYEIARFEDGTIRWAFANANLGWTWITTAFVAPLNQWTYIAVVYDAGVVRTYANGDLVHQVTSAGLIGDAHPLDNDFRIGGRQVGTQYFQGRIDDVRIYNLPLNGCDIRDLAENPCRLVSHWAAENNVLDSADGNDGALQGSAGVGPGSVGQAKPSPAWATTPDMSAYPTRRISI